MRDKRRNVPKSLVDKIFKNQRHRCFWCGTPYGLNGFDVCTVDHLVPVAVYNWTKELYSSNENKQFLKDINSCGNLVACCGTCNKIKSSNIIKFTEVSKRCNSLGVNLAPYKEFYQSGQDRIDTYSYLVKTKSKEQNNTCKLCGRPLINGQRVLRMIECNAGSVIKSSAVFCRKCSRKMGSRSYNEYIGSK